MRRRELITGAAALAAFGGEADARLPRSRRRLWPFPKAVLDLDFTTQRYWWAGRERLTSEFGSFTLGAGTLDTLGLTPADDTVIRVTLSALPNSLVPGALVVNCVPTALPGTARRLFELHDTTSNERINLVQSGASGANMNVVDGNVSQVNFTIAGFTAGTRRSIALYWATNNCQAAMRGILGAGDTSCTMPSPTVLQIGNGQAASTTFLGYIARVIGFDWSFYQWTADDLVMFSTRFSRGGSS